MTIGRVHLIWLALLGLISGCASFTPAGSQGTDPLLSQEARENFAGATWRSDWETSLRPGRVTVDVEPSRVRSGSSSIRLHTEPGDCGFNADRSWNDCNVGNERVGIASTSTVSGQTFYALSVMLSSNMSEHAAQPRYMNSDINLFQWYQLDSGACFNLQYNTRSQNLNIDVRCPNGVYDHEGGRQNRVNLGGQVFDVWHEFVVYANWTTDNRGTFRVLHNGALVMDHNGPTLARSGRREVNEAAFIYRYGSQSAPASRFWPTPSTVWFDDIIRSTNLDEIEKRYRFDRVRLGAN